MRRANEMYSVSVHESLDALGRDRWDCLDERDFFLSSHWLAAVSRVMPQSRCVLVEDETRSPVTGAVLYLVGADEWTFQNPAKLALGEGLIADFEPYQSGPEKERSARLREELAASLCERLPAAVCVVPYSYEPAVRGGATDPEAVETLVSALEELAAGWGAESRAFLYVGAVDGEPLASALCRRHYRRMTIGARCVMPVWWEDLDGYLARFRRRRRWTIGQELAGFAASGLVLELCDGTRLGDVADELARLSAKLMKKYGHGFDVGREQSTLKMLRENVAPFINLFLVRREDRIVAYSLFYRLRDRLQIAFAAQDYDLVGPRDAAHFMCTYYAPVRYAARAGVTEIDFGVGAYRTKSNRGCELRPLEGFFDFGSSGDGDLLELFALQDQASRRFLEDHRPPFARREA